MAGKVKLTKAQVEMLREAKAHVNSGGLTMFDGVMAGVASRLAEKGFVTLPAGHGSIFYSTLHRVRITDAGLAALAALSQQTGSGETEE